MNKKIFSCLFLTGFVAMLAFSAAASAAEFKSGKTFSLYKGETISGNLYAAGGNVTIDGNVDGDLLAGGGTILVNGIVRNDLEIAGGTINVMGEVGQDLRAAGGNIIVNNIINGDMVVAGGTVDLTSNSSVRGDVLVAGGQVVINGPVDGNITVRGGDVTVNSEVKGKLSVTAAQKLTIGSRAKIAGNVSYTSPSEAQIDSGAVMSGAIEYKPMAVKDKRAGKAGFAAGLTFLWLGKMIALIAAALVIFYFFRKETNQIAESALQNFPKQLLRGFIFLFLVPIAVVILMITLIGLPLAFIALFAYLSLLILAGVYSGVVFGGVLYKLIERKLQATITWENIVVGIVALSLLAVIPFIGWLIALVFFLVALGSVIDLVFECFTPKK
jgi:cytoskeletal protein CcmA (bactofilin family)